MEGDGEGEITSWTTQRRGGRPRKRKCIETCRYGVLYVQVARSYVLLTNLTGKELEWNVF